MDIKRRERESRDELSLQDLFESREGHSCSDRALEVAPPSGKKRSLDCHV